MKKTKKMLILSILGIFFFIMVQCSVSDPDQTGPSGSDNRQLSIVNQSMNKEHISLQLIDLFNQDDAGQIILDELQKNKQAVPLAQLLDKLKQKGVSHQTITELAQMVSLQEKKNSQVENIDQVEVAEIWLHNPQNRVNKKNLLFSFAPEGDEDDWEAVKAFNLNKKVVLLDPKHAPDIPVIVIETEGYEALKIETNHLNKILQNKGLQSDPGRRLLNSTLKTTKLTKISLKDDKEPWILGDAEIYAITSGIKNNNNDAQIKIIPLPYLDKAGKTYNPNQILLFWDDYQYNAANIQFYEKDDSQNYKDLISALIHAAGEIANLAGKPKGAAVAAIALAIIEAMPDHWFKNDDDYVDSLYTIERERNYTDYYGAAGNAKVDLVHYVFHE